MCININHHDDLFREENNNNIRANKNRNTEIKDKENTVTKVDIVLNNLLDKFYKNKLDGKIK